MLPTTRLARPDDLPACARVLVDALVDLERRIGRPATAWDPAEEEPKLRYGYAQAPAAFHVAEDGGRVVAFSAAWPRDGHWWLGELFIHPSHQGKGLGKTLLDLALAPGASSMNVFTHASADPPAVALYLSRGMHPWATALHFTLDVPPDAAVPDTLRLAPLTRSSLAFERERFGFARGPEHRHYHETGARGVQLERADGSRAGFAYVQKDGRIGPLAVESPDLVAPALDAALAAAEEAGHSKVSLAVPNANDEALRWCVARRARFRGPNLVMSRRPLATLDSVLFGTPGLL